MPVGARTTHGNASTDEFSEDADSLKGSLSHSSFSERLERDEKTHSPEPSSIPLSDDGDHVAQDTTMDTMDDRKVRSGRGGYTNSETEELSHPESLSSSPGTFVSAGERRGDTLEDNGSESSEGLSSRSPWSERELSAEDEMTKDLDSRETPSDLEAEGDSRQSISSDVESRRSVDSKRSRGSDVESQGRSGNSSTGLAIIVRVLEVVILMVCLVLMFVIAFTPLGRAFFLFDVDIGAEKATYIFGVWGYCKFSWLEFGLCADRQIGWTFEDVPGFNGPLSHAIDKGFTNAMILHLVVAILFIPAFIASVYGLLKPGGSARRRPVSSESSRTYGTSEGRVSDYDPSVSRGKNDYSEDEFTKGTDKDNFADMDSSRLPPDSEVSREERTPDSVPDDISSQKRLRAFICLAVFVAMFFLFLVFLIDVIGVPVTQTKIQNASNGTVNSQIGGAFWCVVACMFLVIVAFGLSFIDLIVIVGRNHARASRKEDRRDETEESYPGGESTDFTGEDSLHGGSKSVLESDVSPVDYSEALDTSNAMRRNDSDSSSFGIDDEYGGTRRS